MGEKRDRNRRKDHPRRRRSADPAMRVFLQILTWLLILIGLAPRPGGAAPAAASRRAPLAIQRRDDWTADQEERERGEGGLFPVLRVSGLKTRQAAVAGRYRVSPSYRRLVSDLRRPAARAEAAEILRRRMPSEAHPWLDDILARQHMAALSWCARPGMTDTEAETAMLRAAVEWSEARRPPAVPEQPEAEATPAKP